ncbi:hypothetical protein F4814DRAFT_446095 [Daldinia grandis]|nr:hypothetical protein F4814DRAFT_446095 [Daldinia grandis]
MTRPQMIRADTIDLQSQDTPSAKKHKSPSSNAAPNGSLAPHQAETLREVEDDRAGEEARSPRISWTDGDNGSDLQQYAEQLANSLNGNRMQSEDALAIAQNGGVVENGSDDGDMDADADDGLDDDMMDKISSSPSIEDGGYTLPPPAWPRRVDSLRPLALQSVSLSFPAPSEMRPPSPCLGSVEHPSIQPPDQQASKASAYKSNRHHPFPDETGRHIENGDVDQRVTSESQSKTINFSLKRQSSAQTIETELDEEEFAISPYYLLPYDASEEDDDDYDNISLVTNTRFLDVGWGGKDLQDLEDIDFEFVYALHTFVATVEGQANATKGDTMVLLDDSNSYWWLVRVVKDSSIGYLPAEHIETPTERLARLNKHRNIDLSATMLGDQAEKTKGTAIKTAIRRRKKTVTFTAPTYVDYSDPEFSSDEEDDDSEKELEEQGSQQQKQEQKGSADDVSDDDDSAKVEPLKPKGLQKQVKSDSPKTDDKDNALSPVQNDRRDSSDIFDHKGERITRNGTVRNTDSFFKDETIETKKITLTPGLLRDDNEARISSDSKESLRQRPSLDKELTPDRNKDDKKKREKDKKEKEKKPSAIRSFFSRKDKKKSLDDDDDSFGKRSLDATAEMMEKDAEEVHAADADTSPEKANGPQRNTSKLQKQQPRADPSLTGKPAIAPSQAGPERGPLLASEPRSNNVANVPPATLRIVESDRLESPDRSSQKNEKGSSRSAVTKESKPQKVTKAKSRLELDDFDSPEEDEATSESPTKTTSEPTQQPPETKQTRPTLPGAYPDSYVSTQTSASELSDQTIKPQRPAGEERLSESPIQVSPVISSNPPALMVDTSSQEGQSSPTSPSPELVDTDNRTHGKQDSVATSTSAATTSTWNDASLRAFFDSGSDIRDLLVIVYDKNDVAPAGPEHPVIGSLFREQNARLAEITTQLDNMLGDWLARKQRLRGTV